MVKYDAVVVGAGNAGLSAAIRMQLGGKKTLELSRKVQSENTQSLKRDEI